MNAEEIIKLNKQALYSSLTSSDIFGKFFNKSILHYAAIMEVFSFNKLGGISYEKLCYNIPKSLGSRSSIQNLLNEGLDKNLLVKIESEKDLEASINDYQQLIKLNNLIEKKFQNTSREISEETRSKINIILKKNEKKT